MTSPEEPQWDIRPEGHAWETGGMEKFMALPPKMELIAGKLFWSDEARRDVLAALLEHTGTRAAVQLGNPEAWLTALRELEREYPPGEAEEDPEGER